MPWVRLTGGSAPRLQVVREVVAGRPHIGPFGSRTGALLAVEALQSTFGLRTPGTRSTTSFDADAVAGLEAAMSGDPGPVVRAHAARIAGLIGQERFEEAAAVRDRLDTFLRGAARAQRLAPVAACAELVAARRTDDGGWEVVLVRHGRLAGTAAVDARSDPRPAIESLRVTAEHVPAPVAPAPAAHPEEADLVLEWLDSPGVRLVDVRDTPGCPPARCSPVVGAQAFSDPSRVAQAVAMAIAAAAVRPAPVDPAPAGGSSSGAARPGSGMMGAVVA